MFYGPYDEDIFLVLENGIGRYGSKGHVFVIGDLNSRTGMEPDFITFDGLHDGLHCLSDGFIAYEVDQPIPKRKSEDDQLNNFGRNLIQLCKSTGLKIINGRTSGDREGKLTFCNTNGTSVIDYVLTDKLSMPMVESFEVGCFNEFSDHAPICMSLNSIKTGNRDLHAVQRMRVGILLCLA